MSTAQPSSSPDSSSTSTDHAEITRDTEFWFDDGNIVLISAATSTCGKVAFRVYKGMLARVSPVFQDLFELAGAHPGPGAVTLPLHEASEPRLFDGCPTVAVTESSIEMRHFLGAVLYSAMNVPYFRDPTKLQPFARMATIARVAHKYQADALATAAFERIEQLFITFDGRHAPSYMIELTHEDAIQVVNLAHLFDSPKTLLIALFLCCVLPPLLLRNGTLREDGVRERLSDEDYELCAGAVRPMLAWYNDTLQMHLREGPTPECTEPVQCRNHARRAEEAMKRQPRSLKNIFAKWYSRGDTPGGSASWNTSDYLGWPCDTCHTTHRETWHEQLADAIPQFLPQWLCIKNSLEGN
ncbi:hypothetical protein C2E23DRAFT_597733 [Lenzites betulinus]|nr:hypothetical protein C2E23DRAFT_597733 [Lenzites betulinus]